MFTTAIFAYHYVLSVMVLNRKPNCRNNRLEITPLQCETVLKSSMRHVESIEGTIWNRCNKDLELSRQVRNSISDNRDHWVSPFSRINHDMLTRGYFRKRYEITPLLQVHLLCGVRRSSPVATSFP